MKTEPFLFSGRIQNCYDSHVHWRGTGSFARRLSLHHLKSESDIYNLSPGLEHYSGEWLLGYGWDQNLFSDKKYPSRKSLDEKFGDTPVYFVRVDGHAAWVNTAALKLAEQFHKNIIAQDGGKILLGEDGLPSGIFIDLAMARVSEKIPKDSLALIRSDLLAGQKAFHAAGFTHIRDLTCDDLQWQVASALEKSGELELAVEQFFSADEPENFQSRLALAIEAKKERHILLRPKGVKIYFDGALGSEGALISQSYNSGSGVGLKLLEEEQLLEMMAACFTSGLEIAVHTIGDQAAQIVALCAQQLKEKNIFGRLHLEHAELLRPETISILKSLDVICHMQPCHWLSDKKWLESKIGNLVQYAFRWNALEKAKISFYYGSDSPIEKSSLQNNLIAIWDAAASGIPAPLGSWIKAHEHPDQNWCVDTFTDFKEGKPIHINFSGKKI